jgi:putative intracellular protease/amidase
MHRFNPHSVLCLLLLSMLTALVGLAGCAAVPSYRAESTAAPAVPPWISMHGRDTPLVAIVGENGGTELTDFMIPYGLLKRAGVDVVTVAAHDGPLRFRPALSARLDTTMAEFDRGHPEGADFVIVPALVNPREATVLAWVAGQARQGATVVSICDGAFVLGYAGLLDGKRATAHWASESMRRQAFPGTDWVRNTRYVADGNVVSSAGISAAMPTALALVEAIAGRERATALAREIDVVDWSPQHDTAAFLPHYGNLGAFAVKLLVNPYLRGSERVGVPLGAGMDEIALAVVADAYSRTGRSQALAVAPTPDPVSTQYGLRFIPEVVGPAEALDVVLPPLANDPPGQVFDRTLAALERRYGRKTAYAVALDFEYPGYAP